MKRTHNSTLNEVSPIKNTVSEDGEQKNVVKHNIEGKHAFLLFMCILIPFNCLDQFALQDILPIIRFEP